MQHWVEIDTAAAAANVRRIKARTDALLCAVVKADCYGHGDAVALAFDRAGADWFGVSCLNEALHLREIWIGKPILVVGPAEGERAAEYAECAVTAAVVSTENAAALSAAAVDAGVTVQVHIKIDTGMGRVGFPADAKDTPAAIAEVCRMPGLRVTGAFQHFAVSDDAYPETDAYTAQQYERFMQTLSAAEALGCRFPIRHCCNSAATLRFPQYHLDMVRVGISLYGMTAGDAGMEGLQPVLSWKAKITHVKTVQPGQKISYGCTWSAERPTEVATVALGYADGYRRALSGKGVMLVHGVRCPVIGRVCMDQLMLDVTGVGAQPGDTATVIGCDGNERVTCEEMAAAIDTIPYEITCLIGARCVRHTPE